MILVIRGNTKITINDEDFLVRETGMSVIETTASGLCEHLELSLMSMSDGRMLHLRMDDSFAISERDLTGLVQLLTNS